MRAGTLSQRVTIQRPADVERASGGSPPEYEDWRAVWAAIEPITGNEYWLSNQVSAEVTHRIRMWADGLQNQLTTEHRIRFGSRTFDVSSIIDVGERHEELILMCTEQRERGAWQA